MKYTLPASSVLTLATIALHATAAVVDYASGEPISSSGYYQYYPTTFHTITKTKDCSYDGDDFTGAYKTISHPEAIYGTAYPDPPDKTYHGKKGPAYQTVTAAPSWYSGSGSGSGSECSAGPWIANPGFEDPITPAWSGSGLALPQIVLGDSFDGSTLAIELLSGGSIGGVVSSIEQTIVIPSGRTYTLTGGFRRNDGNNDGVIVLTVSLGWDTSATTSVFRIPPGPSVWFARGFPFGAVISPSQCVSAVLRISVSVEDEVDLTQNKGLQIDSLALSSD